jgi:hypothetical protein
MANETIPIDITSPIIVVKRFSCGVRGIGKLETIKNFIKKNKHYDLFFVYDSYPSGNFAIITTFQRRLNSAK